ncbi:MAG: HlyD family efflux transporter periplasmic adaptor subunit [Alcanivoracaceae bacterium]|nr:HlyD family efflux transporter periplasmic adaptor subunit [Alcanivoracaceae bacterium]
MKTVLFLLFASLNCMAGSIYITGEIESKNTQHILMPLVPSFNGKISEMAAEGSEVKSGDFLLRVDGSSLDSQIEAQVEQLEVFKATAKKSIIDLKIQLNQAKITFEKTDVSHKIAQLKAEVPLEYIGDLAYKQNQLQLKNAEKSHKKAINDLQEVSTKIKNNQQEIALGIVQKQKKLDYLQETLGLFTIYAQQNGYVIYSTQAWTGEKIQVGDQMNSGHLVMSVSQNRDLQIIAWINAIDVPKLTDRQKVKIQFDAFLDQTYKGEIIKLASGGEDKKIWGDGLYYKVTINVIDQTPANLLLGMSALIEVNLDHKN